MSQSLSVRQGDLVIDFDAAGWVQVTRQSNGMAVQLSKSEFNFLLACCQLRNWPLIPVGTVAPDLDQD